MCASRASVPRRRQPDVLGDTGGNRVTGGCFISLGGEQNERHVRRLLADRIEELDAGLSRQVVAGDAQSNVPSSSRLRPSATFVSVSTAIPVRLFQRTCGRFDDSRVVVDVENVNPVAHCLLAVTTPVYTFRREYLR